MMTVMLLHMDSSKNAIVIKRCTHRTNYKPEAQHFSQGVGLYGKTVIKDLFKTG
jgi:hypothetical protein